MVELLVEVLRMIPRHAVLHQHLLRIDLDIRTSERALTAPGHTTQSGPVTCCMKTGFRIGGPVWTTQTSKTQGVRALESSLPLPWWIPTRLDHHGLPYLPRNTRTRLLRDFDPTT